MTESSEKNDVEERDLNHCAQKTATSLCDRPGARSLEFDVDFMGAFGDEKEAAGKKDQIPPAKGVCENGPERFCQFHQPFDA